MLGPPTVQCTYAYHDWEQQGLLASQASVHEATLSTVMGQLKTPMRPRMQCLLRLIVRPLAHWPMTGAFT